jgi:hypothetical protein
MSVTVRGGDILFNDGTTQSTANNLPANTTNVLNATAAASAGAVGTYGFFRDAVSSTHTYEAGTTLAGSNLRWAAAEFGSGALTSSNNAPSGTWRLMGYSNYFGGDYSTQARVLVLSVWLRIS